MAKRQGRPAPTIFYKALFLIGLFLAIGITVGYYFGYDHGFEKTSRDLVSNEKAKDTSKTEYKNEDLGFSFIYPKEWGEISESNQNDTFHASFSNSNVGFGIISKNWASMIGTGGRGGAMYDYQGFDGTNVAYYYDKDGSRKAKDLSPGYVQLNAPNSAGIYNPTVPYFGTDMTHILFNLEDDKYPAINFYVEAGDKDAATLIETVKTFKLLD